MRIQGQFGSVDFVVKGNLTIDGKAVSQAVLEYVVAYGLKQSVDDARAGKDPGRSRKRLEALKSGKVPTGGFGVRIDPIFRITRDMVARTFKVAKAAKVFTTIESVRAYAEKAGADWDALLKLATDAAKAEGATRTMPLKK